MPTRLLCGAAALVLSLALPVATAAAQWGTAAGGVRVRVRATPPPPPPVPAVTGTVVVTAAAPAPNVVVVEEQAPPSVAVTSQPAPQPTEPQVCTAWWAVGGAPGGGVSLGLNLLLVDENVLAGARFAGHASLGEHATLDFTFASAFGGSAEEQREVDDYVLSTGLHLYLNPRDTFRVFIPVSAGFAFHGVGNGAGDKSWGTHFVANGGLGLQIHLMGPLFFEGSLRAEVRQRLDAPETRLAGVADLGIALLF